MKNKILKPQDLKVGWWYVGQSGCDWLFKFKILKEDKIWNTRCATPFDGWKDNKPGYLYNLNNIREATKAEVTKMYPKEIYTNKPMKQPKQEIEYYEVIKAFPNNKLGIKYYKKSGLWVFADSDVINKYNDDIISDKIYFKPHYKVEKIKIGSYNVEFLPKGSIKIGCAHYSLGDVKACLKVLELQNVNHIDFRGNKVDKEIINKILNRVKK